MQFSDFEWHFIFDFKTQMTRNLKIWESCWAKKTNMALLSRNLVRQIFENFPIFFFFKIINNYSFCSFWCKYVLSISSPGSNDIYHERHDSDGSIMSSSVYVGLSLWNFVQKWNPLQKFQRPMLTTHRQSTGIFIQ